MTAKRALLERLLTKSIISPSGCREWTGAIDDDGYGRINFEGKNRSAHILMWTVNNGLPGKLCVLHRCDNRRCINLDHLFLGTQVDNIKDMILKGRNKHPRGEDSGRAKLSEMQVRLIRGSGEKNTVLAKRYDVSPPLISYIKKRKIWGHLSD